MSDTQTAPADPAALDVAALVQSMSSSGGNPMALILSQLAAQAPDDPRIGMVTQLLQQRIEAGQAPAAKAEAEEDDPAAREATEREKSEHARHLRELNATVKQMYIELRMLRERNDALAAALGACYLCFGTDPVCPECEGRGCPGARPPEPAAYREYVLPALLRIRKLQRERPREALRQGPQHRWGSQAGMVPTRAGVTSTGNEEIAR